MKEIWKDVVESPFHDYYQISNLGRLRTKTRLVTRGGEKNRYSFWKTPKIVFARRTKINPHLFASLYAEGISPNATRYIHKMVAEAFIKKPSPEHIFVTHKDGNFDNNTSENLKWITPSENSIRNMEIYPENKLLLKARNEKNGFYDSIRLTIWKKKNIKKILTMRKWGVSVKEISKIFECSPASIYKLLKDNM